MELDSYVECLLEGDDEACLKQGLEKATDIEGLRRLYVDVIAPSQYKVGELWESGRISVATEHLATATNTYVASMAYAPLAKAAVGGPKALVACTPEELHELGPRLFADVLESDGWDVDFYGTSMPRRDLVEAIKQSRPRVVGLSAALVMHAGSVKETIDAIRRELGDQAPPIIVGGNAFRSDPELWKEVGADMYAADAVEALELLRPLRE